MLSAWVRFGGRWAEFWDLTLADFAMATKAMASAEEDRVLLRRNLNHELARLIGQAYHTPKKIAPPPTKSQTVTDPTAASQRLRAVFGTDREDI